MCCIWQNFLKAKNTKICDFFTFKIFGLWCDLKSINLFLDHTDKTQDAIKEDSKGSSALCIKERALLPIVALLHGKCKSKETLHVRYGIINIFCLPDILSNHFHLG